MKKIKLWSLDKNDNNVEVPTEVEELSRAETEERLESILVQNPDLLTPGLQLIGRQTPTEGGPLDLLGVDADGNLVVFELKRGKLSREAVAQVIDYASYLDDLDSETMFKHISDRSGNGGIEKINDAESWYQEQFPGTTEALEKPPRMVLVGLGADDRTKRMVSYLARMGVDISLVTFYAFKKSNQVFLAKQIEVEPVETEEIQRQSYNKMSNLENLDKLAKKLGVTEMLKEATELIREGMPTAYEWPNKASCSFSLFQKSEQGKPTYRVFISIYLIDAHHGKIQIGFQSRAVEAAKDLFQELKGKYKGLTEDNYDGHYILLDSCQWEEFKEDLRRFAAAIENGWKLDQIQVSGEEEAVEDVLQS